MWKFCQHLEAAQQYCVALCRHLSKSWFEWCRGFKNRHFISIHRCKEVIRMFCNSLCISTQHNIQLAICYVRWCAMWMCTQIISHIVPVYILCLKFLYIFLFFPCHCLHCTKIAMRQHVFIKKFSLTHLNLTSAPTYFIYHRTSHPTRRHCVVHIFAHCGGVVMFIHLLGAVSAMLRQRHH